MADSAVSQRNQPFFVTLLFRNTLAALLLVIVLVIGYLWSLSPMNRGMLRLPELERSVLIWRDTSGIPIIAAQSQSDAWFSLGYVHAQDRLWPMEIVRMAAWGELTSLMGEKAVPLDRWYRRIGFYRHAVEIAAEISDEGYDSLHRYVNGINAYLKAHPFRIPPEFILSKYRPYPWKVEDVLAIGSMLTWLAQPCSTFYPPEANGVNHSLFDDGSLDAVPRRLGFLLSPLMVEQMDPQRDGVRIRMGWGSTMPTFWYETGILAAGTNLRRIWTIPGWPLPFAGVTRDTVLIVSSTPQPGSSWESVSDSETEETVIEYIGSRYSIMTVDTVRIIAGRSIVGTDRGGSPVYGTAGSPMFTVGTIEKQLKLFFDYSDSVSDSDGSHIRIESLHESASNGIDGAEYDISAKNRSNGNRVFRIPGRFGVLSLFGWSDRRWNSGFHGRTTNCEFVTDTGVPFLVVECRHGAVASILPTGQSAVPGSPHSFDQYDTWSRSRLKSRSLTIPFNQRCCVLVPLYPIVH